MKIEDVIQKPLVTEKATEGQQMSNEYYFAVHPKANKYQIRHAVEKLFKVTVLNVNTMNVLGKFRRMGRHMGKSPDWKKAVVRLKERDTINVFEGT